MADYQIVCTVRRPVPPQNHDHLVEVGVGAASTRWTVRQVISAMSSGDTFHTQTRGARADVDTYGCHCGYTTLRTNRDNSTADNLDSLPVCS